jgi:FkbM family methyltransferase
MSSATQILRKFPRVFDPMARFARVIGRQTPIYRVLAKIGVLEGEFTFLQIGANDGISHDPFREFMIRGKARGVTAEPVPEFFTAMCGNYSAYPHVSPENCAVGYPAGRLPFYAYTAAFLKSKGDSKELAGLASFSREKLVRYLGSDEDPSACIREIIIPVLTVEDIMVKHGFDRFDCLFLDCEGHEENILTHLDYERVKPRLIVFEHTHFGERAERIEAHLSARGFAFIRLSHDTVAVR